MDGIFSIKINKSLIENLKIIGPKTEHAMQRKLVPWSCCEYYLFQHIADNCLNGKVLILDQLRKDHTEAISELSSHEKFS